MRTRSVLACWMLATVVLALTAGDQASDQPASAVAQREPTPVERPVDASSVWQVSTAPDCNPLASLRPLGPLPQPGQMPSGSTMARIAERGRLVVGVGQDSHLFAFRDEGLRQAGFETDIVWDIAEAIFGDRDRVVFRMLQASERPEAVRSGQVDVVVAGMSITCQRREKMDFSSVYYEAGQRILVNRGSGIT
ncbi:MAG: transporter substrate-binding domain-containing protein, partial [Pseudonocardiaceae bacterium]